MILFYFSATLLLDMLCHTCQTPLEEPHAIYTGSRDSL